MKLLQRNEQNRNYVGLAFAVPFVGMLMVMLVSGYEPFGPYSVLYSDMYHQYFPFFVEFRRALLSGDGLFYNWSVGLGMDYLGLIAYYLASPLNLLGILVPEAWLLEFFSLLVPVKLGLAGLFFALFLKRIFGRNDWSIVVFGGFYGLCAWALGYQWNIMWLDSFALFPLVVLGTVGLLREKKTLLYTLTLFLAIFSNYYIGFFTCIFVFLLFFVFQFCRWGGWKKFLSDLCRIAVYSLLAIGMTAVLELPALAVLRTTQSGTSEFPSGFLLNIASTHDLRGLLDAMRQVAGRMGGALEPAFLNGMPNVYCGIISIVLMGLYLLAGDVKLRDKVCSVGLLLFFNVSFIIRQLDYIWHGFHFTNMIPYRFSFLYCFVVLYMAYRAWTLRERFSTSQIIGSAVLAAGILACSSELMEKELFLLGNIQLELPVYLPYNLIFLVLYLLVMLSGRFSRPVPEEAAQEQPEEVGRKSKQSRGRAGRLLLAVMGVELIANLVCFGFYFRGSDVRDYPNSDEDTAAVIQYMNQREQDTLFFRADATHAQTLNDGALNGYHGVSTFSSSANVRTTQFMQALGFNAKDSYNWYIYEECSPVANLFLGLKYMIERDGQDRSSTFFADVYRVGDAILLENQAYLPLGFLAQPKLANVKFGISADPFKIQNRVFTAASGVEEAVWNQLSNKNLEVSADGVTISRSGSSGHCTYSDGESGASVIYTYTAPRDGFMCLYFKMPNQNNYSVSVNGAQLYQETIALPQMIAVGDVMTGDQIEIRIACAAGQSGSITVEAAILDHDVFFRGYDILNASTLTLTEFETTNLEGTINCDRDGLLYTSIAQDGNWSVLVDGTEAEIQLVGECMIAVELTQGEHTLTFTYRNEAFSIGWKVSALCLAAFVLLTRSKVKSAKKKA